MNVFLPQIYKKELRRKKLARLAASFFLLLILIAVVGVIFMLPSYFNLALTKNDVLRRLKSQEGLLARRDLTGLETEINAANALITAYKENDARRFSWAWILRDISAAAPGGIKLTNVNFSPSSGGEFAVELSGEALRREDLLGYLVRLRENEKFSAVDSPISNLLREEELAFRVVIHIKPAFYSHER